MTDFNTKDTAPEDFDIDAWLSDAKLPESSVDVYKRADQIAVLQEADRRLGELKEAAEAAPDEPTAALKAEIRETEAAYDAALEVFTASRTTVYLSAVPKAQLTDMRRVHTEKWKADLDGDPFRKGEANEEFGLDVLSASIVGIRPAGAERREVRFSRAQVSALVGKIGQAQFRALDAGWHAAQNQAPEVSADFLSNRSGTDKADTTD